MDGSARGANLIFLISQPRAGSTLLQRILAGHTKIHTTAEPWLMLHPLYALKRDGHWAEYEAGLARDALEDFCTELGEGDDLYVEALRQMAQHLYARALAKSGKTVFLDKTPRYYLIIPELYRVFPEAAYIFLLRNPLAVLASILQTWVKKNWTGTLPNYKNDLLIAPGLIEKGVRHIGARAAVIRYEELVRDPSETVQSLCTSLGLNFEPSMIEYGRHPALTGRMGDPIGVRKHSRPTSDSVDKWMQALGSSPEYDIAEAYLDALGTGLLARLGYSHEELNRQLSSLSVSRTAAERVTAEKILACIGLEGRQPKAVPTAAPRSSGRGSASQPITLFTSICPAYLDLQKKAVASWRSNGFTVVSLNSGAELRQLEPHFPDVVFTAAGRDAGSRFGKPLVFLDDILAACRDAATDICGIINADIVLTGLRCDLLSESARQGLVFGSRVDIARGSSCAGTPYNNGFDYFFFNKSIAGLFPPSDLCLGMVWWDYFLPLIALLNRVPLKKIDPPAACHVTHKNYWSRHEWIRLGMAVFKAVTALPGMQQAGAGRVAWLAACLRSMQEHLLDKAATPEAQMLLKVSFVDMFAHYTLQSIEEHSSKISLTAAPEEKSVPPAACSPPDQGPAPDGHPLPPLLPADAAYQVDQRATHDMQALRDTWNLFARNDPLWAILTNPAKKGGAWDPEDFFATGRKQVGRMIDLLDSLQLTIRRTKALDFGCGIGRLTQALCQHFNCVYGVDISEEMIAQARARNAHPQHCFYLINTDSSLKIFRDDQFDFICSLLTLQHMKPRLASRYLREFLRILAPGGILVFQLPSHRLDLTAEEAARHKQRESAPSTFDPACPKMEMHGIRKEQLLNMLNRHSSAVLECIEDAGLKPHWQSYTYVVKKHSSPAVPHITTQLIELPKPPAAPAHRCGAAWAAGQASQPLISIILPTKSRARELEQFLESIPAALDGIPYELIVYAGGTPDADREALFRQYKLSHIHADREVCGPDAPFCWSKIMNHGFRHASGTWIMYASDDIVLHPHAFSKALHDHSASPEVGGIAFLHRNTIQTYGGFFKHYGYDALHDAVYINFGLIRRAAFEKTGGFDEQYAFYWADVDLCMQVWSAGYRIVPSPSSFVDHVNIADAVRSDNSGEIFKNDTRCFYEKWCTHTLFHNRYPLEKVRRYVNVPGTTAAVRPASLPKGQSPPGPILIDGVIFQLQHQRPAGISRVWSSLLQELACSELAGNIIVLDREGTAPAFPALKTRRIHRYEMSMAASEASALEAVCREERAALFVSTYFSFPEETPALVMLHDMTPEVLGWNLSNAEWRAKSAALHKARAYLCVSRATSRDFRRIYRGFSSKKTWIIPNAVSPEFREHSSGEISVFRKKYNIQKPYFLLVGHRWPHKNSSLFFKAFARLDDRSRYEIVITGGAPSLEETFLPYVRDTVHQVLFLSDRELSTAYSGACALVYPSLHEGFGLPVLEALQSGCPVITCRNSSLPEVAANAALYVGEQDKQGMHAALTAIQQHPLRSRLIARGKKRAGLFSWKRSGELLVQALRETLLTISAAGAQDSAPARLPAAAPAMIGLRGEALAARGGADDAVSAIGEISDRDPDHLTLRNNLAVAYGQKGNMPTSAQLTNTLSINPPDRTAGLPYACALTCEDDNSAAPAEPGLPQAAAVPRLPQDIPMPGQRPAHKPVLLTGSHRSGTTWAGKVLAGSPGVVYLDEPFNPNHAVCACGARCTHWFQYISNGGGHLFYKHLKHIMQDAAVSSGPTDTRCLMKDPLALFSAEWLASAFDMQVVILIRHPAAFASSLKRLNWKYPFSHFLQQPDLMRDLLYPFADRIREYTHTKHDIIDQAALLWNIMYHVVATYRTTHRSWIFVRHEDLSRDPPAGFRDLCTKLDLPFSGRMEQTLNEYSNSANPAEAPEGAAHFHRRNSAANIWNWKQRLAPAEIDRVRAGVEHVAEKFYTDEDW